MNRYQKSFETLSNRKEGAFIPFVMLGDPSYELSLEIIKTLINNGADALELGIPFSDPVADGPIIQNAGVRAFNSGMTVEKCFKLIETVRAQFPEIPIGLLVYANLVYRNGIDHFYNHAKEKGIDSILVVDVPLHEYAPFYRAALENEIAPIFICPPNADDTVLSQIAEKARGYIYMVSRSGTTGTKAGSHANLSTFSQKLHEMTDIPLIQGFGISTPSQVKESLAHGLEGAISGSAIVKLIETYLEEPSVMLQKIAEFTKQMKSATLSIE